MSLIITRGLGEEEADPPVGYPLILTMVTVELQLSLNLETPSTMSLQATGTELTLSSNHEIRIALVRAEDPEVRILKGC